MHTETSADSIMRGIQATVADFQQECRTWEKEIDDLLSQLEAVADPQSAPRQLPTEQHEQIVSHQMRMAADLAELRRVVEQQHELFCSVFQNESGSAATGPPQQPAVA